MLQKILLRDAQKDNTTTGGDYQEKCPVVTVEDTRRIEVYDDELIYLSENTTIDLVQMSSEPHRNFFLVAMDNTIYKYDCVNKELLFQFKTTASLEMILYDKDDKVLVASPTMIRLWDFVDGSEDAEIWTSQEFLEDDKVQSVFVNENSNTTVAGKFMFIVITEKFFYIFEDRLDLKSKHTLDDRYGRVTNVAFNYDTTEAYFGTTLGFIVTWDLKNNEVQGDAFNASLEFSWPVTSIQRFVGVGTENIFLITLNNKEVAIYSEDRRDSKPVMFSADEKEQAGFAALTICNT